MIKQKPDLKKDADSDYWKELFEARMRIVHKEEIEIPMLLKMDWDGMTYKDKAEELWKLVAFAEEDYFLMAIE